MIKILWWHNNNDNDKDDDDDDDDDDDKDKGNDLYTGSSLYKGRYSVQGRV